MVQKDEGLGLSIWNIFGASTSHNSNAQLLVLFVKKKSRVPYHTYCKFATIILSKLYLSLRFRSQDPIIWDGTL